LKIATSALLAVVLGAVGAGSYWLGVRSSAPAQDGAGATAPAASAAKARRLLYYRNPMGLADTSPTPKKDPMGMDYVPVYEGEDESTAAGTATAPNQVRISTEKIQKLGVRTEPAAMRLLGRTVRAAGRVEPDERRVSVIAPKFEGYVEKLLVNATGQAVAKGQPLFETYSPDLVSAQLEYAIAMQGQRSMNGAGHEAQDGMRRLGESSLAHLRHWELSPEQLDRLVRTGEPQRTITFLSPVSGVVTEKKAVQGMRFMPGETLYQVTDLSSVWVIADVSEQDIGLVKTGAMAGITITAYPNETFDGRITYIYPTLKAETRTVPVRVELSNPGQRLKPAMYAQIDIPVGPRAPVLTVPDSAVIDTGTRRLVLVQVQEGRFEPREVELGARGLNLMEVVKGVRAGEQVVVAANFLIDAESNLKAAIGGMDGHGSPVRDSQATAAAGAGSPPAVVGHKAQGIVKGVDLKAGTVSLRHGPVPALKWPAMTMAFKAAHLSLLDGLKPGQSVSFEFVERQPGEYVVTSIAAATGTGATATEAPQPAATGPGTHSGH
jgi:Cu(I)/Ag(I) efflux system membrane fusion protein